MKEANMDNPLTGETAERDYEFAEFRKKASTRISTTSVPPGVPYQTPEGLRAEDEETRIAFDVQGGVYPIRESVFRLSYEPLDAARAPSASEDVGLTRLPWQVWDQVPHPDGMAIYDPDGFRGGRPTVVTWVEFEAARGLCTMIDRRERAASPTPETPSLDVERLADDLIAAGVTFPGPRAQYVGAERDALAALIAVLPAVKPDDAP